MYFPYNPAHCASHCTVRNHFPTASSIRHASVLSLIFPPQALGLDVKALNLPGKLRAVFCLGLQGSFDETYRCLQATVHCLLSRTQVPAVQKQAMSRVQGEYA